MVAQLKRVSTGREEKDDPAWEEVLKQSDGGGLVKSGGEQKNRGD